MAVVRSPALDAAPAAPNVGIRELVRYFLRLGLMGFGGPVALVGQMEKELVGDRKWLTRLKMREAVAVYQSLPGPLAIQVGIFIAYLRGGFWGAWAGGWAFILPNFAIIAALGALYVHLGDLKPVTAIFYGVSPAVIALILHSSYRLARLGIEDWLSGQFPEPAPLSPGGRGRGRPAVHRRGRWASPATEPCLGMEDRRHRLCFRARPYGNASCRSRRPIKLFVRYASTALGREPE
jgi:chromate transport protein ChrA